MCYVDFNIHTILYMHWPTKCANIHVKIQLKSKAVFFSVSVMYMEISVIQMRRPGKAPCSATHR